MAEIAVLLAIQKISIAVGGEILNLAKPLLSKKAESLASLPTNMRQIMDELELINAFLNQVGTSGCNDPVLEAWIRQVRKLAYTIEDTTDQFINVVGERQGKGFGDYLKKIVKKPQSLFSLADIASKLADAKAELKELSDRRDRWIHSTIGGVDLSPNYGSEPQAYLSELDHSVHEDELVGFDGYRKILTGLLQSRNGSPIIAIWGMGGLGKTSLARHVYKGEGSKFDCCAWVSVSQSYKMDDILRSLLKGLYGKETTIPFDVQKLDIRELKEKVAAFLECKKYLIILDDVWTTTAYSEIRDLLVDDNQGSRIIITTRHDDVASLADNDSKLELRPLSEDEAWELFCRKAFLKVENHACPPSLHSLATDMVKKCEGLPLALVAIGSLLSLRPMNQTEWKHVHDQLIWELHNNPQLNHVVEKILNLSYKHLPNYLKHCFLYCSMFPEDYLISRKRLIKLWIAEGFVEKRGQSTVEEVAEGYLRELVRWSMLQVVDRNSFGRISSLRMHDLIRELGISLSEKESFNVVYGKNVEEMQAGSNCRRVLVLRRVSVLGCSDDIRSTIDPSRLHTFLLFDTSASSSSWFSFLSAKARYLAVLDLTSSPVETIPDSIGELFNLKYLCLKETNVRWLPKSVAKLYNLQTLNLERTQVLKLPRELANLKKLRHLLVWKMNDWTYRSFLWCTSPKAFEGLWNLKELQTINEIQANNDLVGKLGNLSQLKCLCISNVKSNHCAKLCSSLSKMRHISRLQMKAINENEVLHLEALRTPFLSLQKLELSGRFAEGTLESPIFSAHANTLRVLSLSWCQLTESPLRHLAKLSNLTTLCLTSAYNGQQLSFHAGWFPNLRELLLQDLFMVNQVEIEVGALSGLQFMRLEGLKELKEVPHGVEFLLSIKQAIFFGLHPEFRRNFEESRAQGKLNHISNLFI